MGKSREVMVRPQVRSTLSPALPIATAMAVAAATVVRDAATVMLEVAVVAAVVVEVRAEDEEDRPAVVELQEDRPLELSPGTLPQQMVPPVVAFAQAERMKRKTAVGLLLINAI
jgi:hypothetical protein